MIDTLQLVLLLLAASVAVVVAFRTLNLPPILGYLLVGASIGPHAFDLIADAESARHLAEFGVVFLMFSIGLEFSLPRLYSMKRIVFGLGLAQVLVTIALAMPLAVLAGLSWQVGFALGGALAMSSTAIVSKLLAERMRTRHAARPQGHGRAAVPGSGRGAAADHHSGAVAAAGDAGRHAGAGAGSRRRWC